MLTENDIIVVRETVERVIGVPLPQKVVIMEAAGLEVDYDGKNMRIAADGPHTLGRGLFLLHLAQKSGKPLRICQKRNIASCGLMVDVSRNAVLKVKTLHRLIDRMTALGLNLLLLYMEDVYEVEGYPYMGYQRGRYTHAELREIDDYAACRGVEVVPCIQTLAHMKQLLQWDNSGIPADQPDVMLADDERTLRFIEAEIDSVNQCFRSGRIHIGMDEAHGMGLGQYYMLHGAQDRLKLFVRHLCQVTDMCRSRGLEPIIWSDMLFRLTSGKNDYYDPEAMADQETLSKIPDVQLCYWDYYHTDEEFYDIMLEKHASLGKTVFAGGLWTWSGFLPHIKRTEATLQPALRSCLRHGIQTVFTTAWGDDGAETDCMLALNLLPLLSEACWLGKTADSQHIAYMGEALTGIPFKAFKAMGAFYPDERDIRTGKSLIWCDVLFYLTCSQQDAFSAVADRASKALTVLEGSAKMLECEYASLLFETIVIKAQLLEALRPAYLAGDRAYLAKAVEETLPALASLYELLLKKHRSLWERDMKRPGWEVLCLRYSAVIGRLWDVRDELRDYLDGRLASVEALEEPMLNTSRWGGRQRFSCYISPSCLI